MAKKQPKKEEKKKKTHPYASEKITVQYIHENPNCTKRDLNRDLAHDYTDEPRIMKEMTRTTLNRGLEWLVMHDHLFERNGLYRVNNELSGFRKLYPDIWNKKQMELENYGKDKKRHYEMLQFYVDDDILKRAIKKHTKIEILSKETNFNFSNEMNDLFNDFVYSILIECFLNNPDNWLNIKKPEDLQFKIKIEANWNKDPEILKRLNERKEKSLRDNYLYPFGWTKFNRWGNENNEPIRKERIANKTEEDLFNKAFTENQIRKEEIEKYKQKVLQLKPIFLARLDKEYEDIISPEENKIAIKKLKNIVEKEYIDFREDVVLAWTDVGKPVFEDRLTHTLSMITDMIIYDRNPNKENDGVNREEKWRKEWDEIRRYGDYRSKKIESKNRPFIPEDVNGFEFLIEEMRRRYPEKMKRFEFIVDFDFKYHSIRSIMNNKDYFKSEEKEIKLCLECGKEHTEFHAYCKECIIEIRKKNKYTKTCSGCGKVHEERYSYCKECWDKMTKICPSCGRDHIEYGKYCYSCSFKNLEENDKN